MKFTYVYKTSDGSRHEEKIDAPSREDAFSLLRGRGIRPIKVIAIDGSKANGEVRGVRKRIVTLIVSLAVIVTGISVYLIARTDQSDVVSRSIEKPKNRKTEKSTPSPISSLATPLARQRIPGDRTRLVSLATNFFSNPLEFHLARFAEPGRPLPENCPTNVPFTPSVLHGKMRPCDFSAAGIPAERRQNRTGADLRAASAACVEKQSTAPNRQPDLASWLAAPIRIYPTDFTEHVDLKRIVTGLKREMSAYLKAGGTAEEYCAELVKRQQQEITYRTRAESNLFKRLSESKQKPTEAYEYWLKANAQLKSMGIYEIPLPDTLRTYQLSLDLSDPAQ